MLGLLLAFEYVQANLLAYQLSFARQKTYHK